MIHQFSELGRFFLERQGVSDPLERIAQDPGANFGPTVLLLVFGHDGFRRIQVESYDELQRRRYLYRKGPPNTWDPTPTSGMPQPKSGQGPAAFLSDLHTRIARLGNSVRDAIAQSTNLMGEEAQQLEALSAALPEKNKKDDTLNVPVRERIVQALMSAYPPDSRQRAFLSVAWQSAPNAPLKYVGDFQAFREQLLRLGGETAARSQGIGQCCVCGQPNVPVLGNLQVPNFKFYTLDKPGSISGGFDENKAWRNFPVCRECCAQVDFSGEWVKKELVFRFYGFNYLLLPTPVRPGPTQVLYSLRRLIDAKVDNTFRHKLTEAEDELFAVIAEEESNRLQVDLLFYRPLSVTEKSFRPILYISGLLPTRFRELFRAKDEVDAHPWLRSPSPVPFTKDLFTFGSLRRLLPAKTGGSSFDDDFLAATRAALEKRAFNSDHLLTIGMRLVQQDFLDKKAWQFRLADLLRSLLFFEFLVPAPVPKLAHFMPLPDYGATPQADRVRALFNTAPGRLKTDPSAQAVFLLGACCARIENIQLRLNNAMPFSGKLKAFRLNQPDIQRLFVDAKEKARVYGPEQERKVAGLLGCTAAALASCPDQWPLSPDEISYYFALGHALRSRLADPNTKDEETETPTIAA